MSMSQKIASSGPRKRRSRLYHCVERNCSQAKSAPHFALLCLSNRIQNKRCVKQNTCKQRQSKECKEQFSSAPGSLHMDCSSDQSLTSHWLARDFFCLPTTYEIQTQLASKVPATGLSHSNFVDSVLSQMKLESKHQWQEA